jgi:hypothetical protein
LCLHSGRMHDNLIWTFDFDFKTECASKCQQCRRAHATGGARRIDHYTPGERRRRATRVNNAALALSSPTEIKASMRPKVSAARWLRDKAWCSRETMHDVRGHSRVGECVHPTREQDTGESGTEWRSGTSSWTPRSLGSRTPSRLGATTA